MANGSLQRRNKVHFVARILTAVLILFPVRDSRTTPLGTTLSVADRTRWLNEFEAADGDLVFRRGRDLMSRLVLSQTDVARFSHVGLIAIKDGVLFVVHAIPRDGASAGGVLWEPLTEFASIANAAEVGIYRANG